MKLVVDREACQGHGRCMAVAPEIVEDLDVTGQPVLENDGEFGPELLKHARAAVDNCPESALSIVGEEADEES